MDRAAVALPTFTSIVEGVWKRRQVPLDPPSSEASRLLVSELAQRSRRDRPGGKVCQHRETKQYIEIWDSHCGQ